MALSKAEAARLNGRKGGRPRGSKRAASVSASPKPTPAAPQTKEVPRAEEIPPVENPHGLTPKELLFVEHYFGAANFVASEAYRLAGFACKPTSLSANASRLLRKDRVQAAIAERMARLVATARRGSVMDGDEAMERMSMYARADMGKVLGENDPLAKLPDDVRLCIKAVREGKFGRTIELYDAKHATELMAKAAGRLQERVEHTGKDGQPLIPPGGVTFVIQQQAGAENRT